MSIFDNLSSVTLMDEHRPWPRAVIAVDDWQRASAEMAEGRWELVALWGERTAVHIAVREAASNEFAILTLGCPNRHYPSVGSVHPPAIRLERTIHDLYGLTPIGLADTRPWLDHGRWGVTHPLGAGQSAVSAALPYRFLPAEGEGLHHIGVGPVHAGIIEPGFFHFAASGETVVRLEERFGYVHKGIEGLMEGASLDHAIKLAGRTSGDSTVAYAYAFAMAAEAALEIEVPPRARWLRAAMAEIERIANHLSDFGAICNDAAFAIMQAQCAVLRERVLRTAQACFGHRMMRDCIMVGGTASDLDEAGITSLSQLAKEVGTRLVNLKELYDKTASLLDRTVGSGILKTELAQKYAVGGFIGRASGRAFDARKAVAYPPYDLLDFEVPRLEDGDVNARVWIRIREIEQSLSLLRQILDRLPKSVLRVAVPSHDISREGTALAEGFRGDIFVSLRIGRDGLIERCHLRDPSWFQWPLLEAVIEGNIVADFPLCNKSFNCSYSGHDL